MGVVLLKNDVVSGVPSVRERILAFRVVESSLYLFIFRCDNLTQLLRLSPSAYHRIVTSVGFLCAHQKHITRGGIEA